MKRAALLLLLLIPLATAQIGDVQLLVDGEPLGYVNYGSTIDATLQFEKTPGATLVQIESPQLPSGKRVIIKNCETCRTSITLTTEQHITLEFAEDVNGNRVVTEKQLVLDVDNVQPEINDVKVGTCTAGCLYSPHQNTITFRLDDDRGLNMESLSVTANEEEQTPSCYQTSTDQRCALNLTGTGDQSVSITISDRAGNHNSKHLELRYDDTPPIIPDGAEPHFITYGYQIPAGKASKLVLDIEEAEGATITFQSPVYNGTGTCERQGRERLECIVDVIPEKPWNGEAQIIITDKAGNPTSTTMHVEALEGIPETEPNFWDLTADPAVRINPELFVLPRYYPVDLTLTPKRSAPATAQPVAIEITNCRLPGIGSGGITVDPVAPKRETQIAFTLGNPERNVLENPSHDFYNRNLTCDAHIWSRVGNVMYQQPEREEITFKPTFSRLSELSTRDMLENERRVVQENIAREETTLLAAERTIMGLQTVCGVSSIINAGAGAMNLGALAALAVPGGRPVAEGLDKGSSSLAQVYRAVEKSVAPFCFAISCDLWTRGADHAIGDKLGDVPGLEEVGQVGYAAGFDSVGDFFDPYQSRYAAIATACLPAYFYHERVSLNTQCQYQECLTTTQTTGFAPDECSYERQYQECRTEARNHYFLNPKNVVVDKVLAQAEILASNPLSLVGLGSSALCWSGILETDIPCKIVMYGDDLAALQGGINVITQSVNHYQQFVGGTGDACGAARAAAEQFETPRPFIVSDNYCNVGFTKTQYRGHNYVVFNGEILETGERPNTPGSEAEIADLTASDVVGFTASPAKGLSEAAQRDILQAHENCRAELGAGAVEAFEQASREARVLKIQEDKLAQLEKTYELTQEEIDQARAQGRFPTRPKSMSAEDFEALTEQYREQCPNGCVVTSTPTPEGGTATGDEPRIELVDSMNHNPVSADFIGPSTTQLQRELRESGACEGAMDCWEQARALQRKMVDPEIVALEEQEAQMRAAVANQTEKVKEQEDAYKDSVSEVRLQALREEYSSGWHMGVRRTIGAGLAYAGVPKLIGDLTGYTPLGGLWNTEFLPSREELVEHEIEEQCRALDGASNTAAYEQPLGQPAAKISARKEQTADGQWTYQLNVYLNVQQNPEDAEDPELLLIGSGTPKELDPVRLHAGQDTRILQLPGNYREVCIEFAQPLKTFFSSYRGDADNDRLCADIREVRS